MRKTPQQMRAKETIDVIFEATARILERDGRNGLSTNAIAALAGVSVGTLYHYFPSKEAVLVAMARRELDQHAGAVLNAFKTLPDGGENPIRTAIKSLIAAFATRRTARQIAAETLITQDLGHELARPAQAVAQMLSVDGSQLLDIPAETLSPARLFVLTRAVSGVINAATREQSPLFGTQEFEDELVNLAQAVLGDPRQSA